MYEKLLSETEKFIESQKQKEIPILEVWGAMAERAEELKFVMPENLGDFEFLLEADKRFIFIKPKLDEEIEDVDLGEEEGEYEVGEDFFEVEKSEDGYKFIPLSKNSKIKAKGNTSTPQFYNTTDENPSVGMNYYRLHMVDLDGKERYSNVISLQAAAKLSVKIAPNPFKESLLIDLNTALEHDLITVELMDVSGRVLIKNKVETRGKSMQFMFDTEGVSAGIYILRLLIHHHPTH